MWHWHAHLVEAQVMKNVNIDSMINYQGIEKGFFYKGGGSGMPVMPMLPAKLAGSKISS